MKLFHITKQGNLHFQLKDGRLAAIYPKTGYVRVSHSLKNFTKNRTQKEIKSGNAPKKIATFQYFL